MSPAFTQALQELGAGVEVPLDDLHFPMALTDIDGIIRWQNRESIDLVGDRRGSSSVPVVGTGSPPRLSESTLLCGEEP